jgi:TPR repeat protein
VISASCDTQAQSAEPNRSIAGFGPTANIKCAMTDLGAAYKKGDYATAVGLVSPLAEQGNVHAQARLAFLYANGEGVSQRLRWISVAKRPSRAAPLLSTTSGTCAASARACRRTTQPRRFGIAKRLSKTTHVLNLAVASGHRHRSSLPLTPPRATPAAARGFSTETPL